MENFREEYNHLSSEVFESCGFSKDYYIALLTSMTNEITESIMRTNNMSREIQCLEERLEKSQIFRRFFALNYILTMMTHAKVLLDKNGES